MSAKLPVLHWEIVERVVLGLGYSFLRQSGSHRTYGKSEVVKIVTIPTHRDLARGTLRSIIRNLDISVDKFMELLD